jgi:RHH-type rel operon transcriptional repressor/antitoxin RelB
MPISIRLPSDVEARLNALAARTGRSKTYYAIEAIVGHIDDLEDLYLAERELLEVRAGNSVRVPLEELITARRPPPSSPTSRHAFPARAPR